MDDEEFALEVVPLGDSDEVNKVDSNRSSVSPLSSVDLEVESTPDESDPRITSLDPDEDFIPPYDKQEVIARLKLLRHYGHTIEFNKKMSLEELLKIYEAKIEEMRRKNEEETQRAQLSLILLFLSERDIVSYEEAARLMKPEVPLQEIVNLINKHANQIKKCM